MGYLKDKEKGRGKREEYKSGKESWGGRKMNAGDKDAKKLISKMTVLCSHHAR